MSNQVVVVSTKLLHFLAVISGQAMHHLLPVDAKTDIEGYLHVARLRRPPPKPQRARACSAAEPPSHIQPQKPKISKVRLRRASHERHEKNTVPLTAALWGQRTPCDHRAGHAATDTLTLGARPSAAARPTTDDDTRVHRCTEEYHALYDSRTHTTNQHVDQAMGDAFHDLVSLDLLEVNEITRIKMSCSTINAPCDLTTAEIQQVQSEIGASPPGRATCNHGMLLQEDHFPLTRLGTRMEPSNLLLPTEARRPPRPSHWPALHTRSKSDEPRV